MKTRQENDRDTFVESVFEGIRALVDSRIKGVIARVEALERKNLDGSHLAYRGVWQGAGRYVRGDVVTYDGSAWHANAENPTAKPGVSDDWQLMVKKGRDAT